jgi:hypothetical protein
LDQPQLFLQEVFQVVVMLRRAVELRVIYFDHDIAAQY